MLNLLTQHSNVNCLYCTPTLIASVGNGGRIKAKFTIVNRPESRSFITSLIYLNFVFIADNLSVFLICDGFDCATHVLSARTSDL